MKLLLNCKALAATLALACVACAAPPDVDRPLTAPTLTELKSASFSGLGELSAPVRLQNGSWRGAPAEAGAASRDVVMLDNSLRVSGDLDADGQDEAVVLLTHSPGGTAAWSYLAVVKRVGDGLRNLATVALGDRVQIRTARIEGGKLLASVVRAGPNDAACCPGEIADLTWTLADNRLKAHGPVTTQRLSLDALAGTTWVLRAWDIGEPAPAQPVVTLSYAAGRVMGHSGCNRYTAGVTAGSAPGELRVGLAASTRMACPEPESSVETRFLENLHAARRFGFRSGWLAISTSGSNGADTTMLFEAAKPSTPP
jgi:heat shock protein HslJ